MVILLLVFVGGLENALQKSTESDHVGWGLLLAEVERFLTSCIESQFISFSYDGLPLMTCTAVLQN
jgi:hypothetical protein